MSRRTLVLALVIGGLLAIPTSAVADRHYYVADPGYTTSVELPASNGYQASLWSGYRGAVGIKVSKDGVTTEYRTKGARYGKYGAIAKFSGFGQVRLRFIPNGKERHVSPPPWCDGPAGVMLDGRVVGQIRFVGEEQYTSIAAMRAKAEVETWPRMRCRILEPDRRHRPRKWTANFFAFNEAQPNIIFSVKRYSKRLRPASRQVAFGVYTGSFEDGVVIYRSARVVADNSTFVVPDPKATPENVVFRPPPPFSGTASFQRTPESVFTWEGDLTVQFPGIEPLALTGPRFYVDYCAQRGCAHQSVPDLVLGP
ncbi:MAG TPA: hypothetical protein VFN18_08700 [Solirubrobacterales bacterium]|nr:hypothetical protein [Solirubrobacterales bacterium]